MHRLSFIPPFYLNEHLGLAQFIASVITLKRSTQFDGHLAARLLVLLMFLGIPSIGDERDFCCIDTLRFMLIFRHHFD